MSEIVVTKGIKETKELLKGILELSKVSAEVLKDGAQVQDLIDGYLKLSGDAEKKAALEAAIANISEVPGEIKDLKFAEMFELGAFVFQELPALLEAFKAKSA